MWALAKHGGCRIVSNVVEVGNVSGSCCGVFGVVSVSRAFMFFFHESAVRETYRLNYERYWRDTTCRVREHGIRFSRERVACPPLVTCCCLTLEMLFCRVSCYT